MNAQLRSMRDSRAQGEACKGDRSRRRRGFGLRQMECISSSLQSKHDGVKNLEMVASHRAKNSKCEVKNQGSKAGR
jgi:hypothetical protein